MRTPGQKDSDDSAIVEEIHKTILRAYGIDGELSRLPGENLNYLVLAKDGRKFVAKIAGDELPPSLVSLQGAAIEHATNKSRPLAETLEFPEILKNFQGEPETGTDLPGIGAKRLRFLSFIEGDNLSERVDISTFLASDLGRKLAAFSLSMADFTHPAADRIHRWNLAYAGQHRHKIEWVESPEKRALLTWAFEQWTNHASPVLPQLPWQFIHGDFNPENIRVRDGRVVGLLDFDDACWNPAICELAICLAYQMMDREDPWTIAADLIGGYQSIRRMMAAEEKMLLPLVCGRLAVSISVATERRRIDPTNANWFVSEKPAWRLLEQIHASEHRTFPT